MADFETGDYIAAAVVGTLLGVGAALLFRHEPETRRERIMKELKPYRKALGKKAKHARRRIEKGADATTEWGGDVVDATRELLTDFRHEVGHIMEQAREEMSEMIADQLKDARKAVRKATAKVR